MDSLRFIIYGNIEIEEPFKMHLQRLTNACWVPAINLLGLTGWITAFVVVIF